MRRRPFPTIVGIVALALSCSKTTDEPVGPAVTVATITVSPNPDTLIISSTRQFTAVGKDIDGNPVTTTPTWSVASGKGSITAQGMFTADTAPGTSVVQATSGAVSGSATVVVKRATAPPASLATITVTPNNQTIQASSKLQFSAAGKNAAGNTVPITPVWSVASGGGTITSAGVYTAGTAAGTATIKAASGNVSGTATVTVTAAAPVLATIELTPNGETIATSGTLQFSATGKDAAGNAVPLTPEWSVTSGGGSISSSGLFTAGSASGTSTVRVAQGAIAATATVEVSAIRLVFAYQPGPTPAGTRILSSFLNGGDCAAADHFVLPIVVRAVDAAGHYLPNDGVVTLRLGANPGGGTLSGTVSERTQDPNPNVHSDVAFPDVRINATGGGYTLIASSPGKVSATSERFDVVPAPGSAALRLFFNRIPCTNGEHGANVWHAGTTSPVPIEVIALGDDWVLQHGTTGEVGEPVTSFSGPVTLTVQSGGRLTGTLTVNAVNGRATFSNVIAQDPGHYVVIATTPGLIANRVEFDVIAP